VSGHRSVLVLTGAVMLAVAGPAARAALWQDLWLTPDQQAERLLESGHAAEAARRFRDPRLRAYAELKAGQYDAAARELNGFDDVESQYNRANALARGGHLRAALKAYDALLARAPQHRDARYNRELVASALERRDPGSEGEEEQGAAADQQGRAEQGQGNPSEDRARREGSKRAQEESSNGARATQGGSNDASEQQGAQRDAELAASLGHDARGQRAAAAARDPQGRSQPKTSDAPSVDEADGGSSTPQAKSEQALALEQWLRRIPEDPEGLLRRKFLIEHLLRQQQEEP